MVMQFGIFLFVFDKNKQNELQIAFDSHVLIVELLEILI
jgi:hypothetical protein